MMKTDEDDVIPSKGKHRGVALHGDQSPGRLNLVRAEIDHVLDELNDPASLLNFASDSAFSPEARLCAAAKGRATLDQARDERQSMKGVTSEKFVVAAAGLDLPCWQSPRHFCSDLDDHDRAVPRPRPLNE